MKKLVAVALAAVTLTAFGAWEKIGTVRLADVDALVKGVTRLGEFTGNQMLGIMASQSVGEMPVVQFFGPGRPGAAMSFELFLDGETLAKDPKNAFESLEYAVLYPIAQTRAAFIASHPGAVETNGLVRVCGEDDGDDEDEDGEKSCCTASDDVKYVAFSEDGKWAAYSDKPEQATAALGGIKAAERKMDGDLAKIVVSPKGWKAIARAVELSGKEGDVKGAERENYRKAAAVIRQLAACACGLRVDARGLDVRGVVRVVKNSALAKVGLKTFDGDAWKTAGADALIVSERAEDSGCASVSWDDLRALFRKHGIDTPFLSVAEPAPHYSVFTVDVPAVVEYFKGISNVVGKIDAKNFIGDLTALDKGGELVPLKNPATGTALAIRGFTPAVDPLTRYEATLPEAKGKPAYARLVASYYSLFKAVAPVILANVGPEVRQMLEPMFATLPAEGKSGIAYAAWREKDSHRFIFRVGADEFKGVSACFAAFSAVQMQKAMKQAKLKSKPKGGGKTKVK